MKQHIAFFAGSFNPFTVGHLSIVQRAIPLFDRIIVALGINESKDSAVNPTGERIAHLQRILERFPQVQVVAYSDLTVEAARRHGATCLLRGVRSVADYEYERNIADINREISGMETLLIMAEPQLSMVSSSMVRELSHYGLDVSRWLPDDSEQSE